MSVARKLQLKPDHAIALLHVPENVSVDVPEGATEAPSADGADAVVLFVRTVAELEQRAEPALAAARRDALAWIAYPKGGQLGTDLNRDRLWEVLASRGVRPVRQVSIDGTWSALRFRPAPS